MLVKTGTDSSGTIDGLIKCPVKYHPAMSHQQSQMNDDHALIREVEFIGSSRNETAKKEILTTADVFSQNNHFQVFAFCFGPFEVFLKRNIDMAVGWRTTKAKELLAYFFHHRNHFVSRQEIIADLWPDMDPEQASTLLHTNLYYVRNALKSGNKKNGIIYARGGYRMDLNEITSDLIIFEDLIKRIGKEPPDASINLLEQAASIYRGEYFLNADWDWAVARREQYQQIYLSILKKIATFYTEQHNCQWAAHYLRRVLEVNPLLEDTHAQLMQVYAYQGDRRAIMSQYEILCKVLEEELGIEPESRTKKLYYELLS